MAIRETIERWRRYRTLVREMSEYSHGELAELGIVEADIGRIAAEAVYADTAGAARASVPDTHAAWVAGAIPAAAR